MHYSRFPATNDLVLVAIDSLGHGLLIELVRHMTTISLETANLSSVCLYVHTDSTRTLPSEHRRRLGTEFGGRKKIIGEIFMKQIRFNVEKFLTTFFSHPLYFIGLCLKLEYNNGSRKTSISPPEIPTEDVFSHFVLCLTSVVREILGGRCMGRPHLKCVLGNAPCAP